MCNKIEELVAPQSQGNPVIPARFKSESNRSLRGMDAEQEHFGMTGVASYPIWQSSDFKLIHYPKK